MSKNKENIIGGLILLSGAIIGAAGALLFKENQPKNAGDILLQVKNQMAIEGSIEGSWIDYDPIEYHMFDSRPLVYIGGITVTSDQSTKVYQFAADVYTGDIVDIFQIEK